MRLTKIKLAGFKSFVDPVTFHVPGPLLAVVGPNGCGKSNIIDAVRWVMGESAASHLRGDSMEDVIFNGSDQRKPVGQAQVEMVFDNSDGRLEGAWGNYNEVAVKRVATRGAQSAYFINNTRCRRRDIAAIFLGTGLGPRSYAIIEQGTISRIIESKPEELRVFLEEAAGISKYKERRRETANRIRHTRDNLDRLNDLREEQQKQLQHLQRQARNAERYRQLKAEERTLRAQLLALRWQKLNTEAGERQRQIGEQQTRLEALLAEQRRRETEQVQARVRQTELNDALSDAQEQHYQAGAEVARAEQTLEHRRQLSQRRRDERLRTEQALTQIDEQDSADRRRLSELQELITAAGRRAAAAEDDAQLAEERLAEAEQALADWQTAWDDFSHHAAESQRAAEVERARIEQLERQQLQSQRQAERVQLEQSHFDAAAGQAELTALQAELDASHSDAEAAAERLAELERRTAAARERERELEQGLGELRDRRQTGRGRLSSLRTLQEAALADGDGEAVVDPEPRLADRLHVAVGWEAAVEAVLGPLLTARCVTDFDAAALAINPGGRPQALIDERSAGAPPRYSETDLQTKLDGPAAAVELAAGVGLATSLEQALAERAGLASGESLITPDGVWLGRGWLRAGGAGDPRHGMLARGREIEQLDAELAQFEAQLGELGQSLHDVRAERERLDGERRQAEQQHTKRQGQALQLDARLESRRERLQQQGERHAALGAEMDELHQLIGQSQQELGGARERLELALAAMSEDAERRERLEAERDQRRALLADARAGADQARGERQQAGLALQTVNNEHVAVEQALGRLAQQRRQLLDARAALDAEERQAEQDGADSEQLLRARLEEWLARRADTEQALTAARQQASAQDDALRQLEQTLAELAQRQQAGRDTLAEQRLRLNEASVRRQTLADQLAELDADPASVLRDLPEQAIEADWQRQLEQTGERIQRLGAINLAAIDELKEVAERQAYLDAQNNDLIEALQTLEDAMAKIDRETRARFKDMYDRVNAGLQALFPRLFGGGQAYLDLTSSDPLEAGVSIMARPPGKRNGTIHLLSGGEKALAAVALIFAIFQLNPAPFCMLDEVDAPLDDANVGRFSELLQEMSAQVQFIVVTHNKGTMEVATHLSGVTMQEPGVSRLVAVDIDEAVRLATA